MSGDTFEFDDKARVERLVGTLHDPGATTGDVLTVQADKSIAAVPGGGGSGGVQTITVPVSSAQILDLLNTDVVLIPGTPGFVTLVQSPAMVAYFAGTTPYLDGGGVVSIISRYEPEPGSYQGWEEEGFSGVWDQPTDQFFIIPSLNDVAASLLSSLDGVDVVMRLQNGDSPTLGDGTLAVTLPYFLAPTA